MKKFGSAALLVAVLSLGSTFTLRADDDDESFSCPGLPSAAAVRSALQTAVAAGNGGLANQMWATVVNRDGQVCLVVFSGSNRAQQWRASRVISAQKANTAQSLSLPQGAGGVLPGLALSTANLYSAVQPGGSLFGLQESNPVDTDVAYGGSPANFGQGQNDPMVGKKIGGVNVFGGGLALYNSSHALVGGIGVSGDTSCTDHFVAWRVRHALNLDFVPTGVAPGPSDNIIYDIAPDAHLHPVSAGGYGHPMCSPATPAPGTLPPTQ